MYFVHTFVWLLQGGKAATSYLALEVENGTKTGAVVTGETSGVSGNASVKFGSAISGAIPFEDDFNGSAGTLPDTAKWGDWSACAYNGTAAVGGAGGQQQPATTPAVMLVDRVEVRAL
ncbi:MAG TPA: hypothetical protein VF572_03645 [Candidatus Saccharimonadales bacterium]|jgi:hypothetical protein